MMPENKPTKGVTLRDIAKRSEFSVATVSRALRDDPGVTEATARKVKEIAESMGYRPNRMVKSLMAARRLRERENNLIANICFLNTHPNENMWNENPHGLRLLESVRSRAAELGYGVEEIWAVEPGLSCERLDSILYSRGVQGILLPGTANTLSDGGFNWAGYSVVCIGDKKTGQPDVHRCRMSANINVKTAFWQLRRAGYKRIGFVGFTYVVEANREMVNAYNRGCPRGDVFDFQDTIYAALSGYTACQTFVEESDRIWPFIADGDPDADLGPLVQWLLEIRPEVVISNGRTILDAVQEAELSVPKDIALVHCGLGDDVAGWAGVDPLIEDLGKSAVDEVTAQIERNERGIREVVKSTQIEGFWRDGWTAPNRI